MAPNAPLSKSKHGFSRRVPPWRSQFRLITSRIIFADENRGSRQTVVAVFHFSVINGLISHYSEIRAN
jgi:hypothetical protein